MYGATLLVSGFPSTSRDVLGKVDALGALDALGSGGKGVSVKISFTTLNRISSPEIKNFNFMTHIEASMTRLKILMLKIYLDP